MSETTDFFDIPFEVPDWLKRVAAEHQETEDRLTKLKAFLATNPTHIGDTQLALLKQQEKVMQEYANILMQRLEIAHRDLVKEHFKKPSVSKSESEPEFLYHVTCLWGCEEVLPYSDLGGYGVSLKLMHDFDTIAAKVRKGTRRGKRAEIRTINVRAMREDGFVFEKDSNAEFWKTETVPYKYIIGVAEVYGLRDLKALFHINSNTKKKKESL